VPETALGAYIKQSESPLQTPVAEEEDLKFRTGTTR